MKSDKKSLIFYKIQTLDFYDIHIKHKKFYKLFSYFVVCKYLKIDNLKKYFIIQDGSIHNGGRNAGKC